MKKEILVAISVATLNLYYYETHTSYQRLA